MEDRDADLILAQAYFERGLELLRDYERTIRILIVHRFGVESLLTDLPKRIRVLQGIEQSKQIALERAFHLADEMTDGDAILS